MGRIDKRNGLRRIGDKMGRRKGARERDMEHDIYIHAHADTHIHINLQKNRQTNTHAHKKGENTLTQINTHIHKQNQTNTHALICILSHFFHYPQLLTRNREDDNRQEIRSK